MWGNESVSQFRHKMFSSGSIHKLKNIKWYCLWWKFLTGSVTKKKRIMSFEKKNLIEVISYELYMERKNISYRDQTFKVFALL